MKNKNLAYGLTASVLAFVCSIGMGSVLDESPLDTVSGPHDGLTPSASSTTPPSRPTSTGRNAVKYNHTKECKSSDGRLVYFWGTSNPGTPNPRKLDNQVETITFQGMQVPKSIFQFVPNSYKIVGNGSVGPVQTTHYQVSALVTFEPPYQAVLDCVEQQVLVPAPAR